MNKDSGSSSWLYWESYERRLEQANHALGKAWRLMHALWQFWQLVSQAMHSLHLLILLNLR